MNKKLISKLAHIAIPPAYLAGLFDGEGNITIAKTGKYERSTLRVSVTNTNRDVLIMINKAYGGRLNNNTFKNRPKHHKISFRLTWHESFAADIILLMYPYLIIKAPQAKLALDFWHLHATLPKSLRCKLLNGHWVRTAKTKLRDKQYKQKMTKLNRRGVKL